jgi:vitellogenic carboxypeptidase-like protein
MESPLLGDGADGERRGWARRLAGSAVVLGLVAFIATYAIVHRASAEDDDVVVNISDFLPDHPELAREAAFVADPSILPGVESWAAFATVDENLKNHLFWWYLAPQVRPKAGERFPLLIWLQGGPGASSLFGMFSEFGPYKLHKNLTVEKRPIHWNEHFGLLFVDNPAGTGFSYTEENGYCNSTKTQVSDQLFALLEQFFMVFPELKSQTDFYVTGESYGGHYCVGLGHKLMREIESGKSDIPFRGVSVGNAWVDPVNQMAGYPDMLYNEALITGTEKKIVQDYCDRAVAHIHRSEFEQAFLLWDEMINGDLYGYTPYVTNVTGLKDYFNFLRTREPLYEDYFSDFVQLPRVRKAIHVGNQPFGATANKVEQALRSDFMVSFKKEMEELLEKRYKVLVYNGQLDIIIGPVLTRRYLERLDWFGAQEHLAQPQHVWRLHRGDEKVLGYVKSGQGLTTAVIRDASHMAPSDCPHAALDLMTRFIYDLPFN